MSIKEQAFAIITGVWLVVLAALALSGNWTEALAWLIGFMVGRGFDFAYNEMKQEEQEKWS